jgi:hypothetical protein
MGERFALGQAIDVVPNQEQSIAFILQHRRQVLEGLGEVTNPAFQPIGGKGEANGNPEQVNLFNVFFQPLIEPRIPLLALAFLQQALDAATNDLADFLDSPQMDVTADDPLIGFSMFSHELGQGCLADASFATDEDDLYSSRHNTAQSLNQTAHLFHLADEKLRCHRLPWCERTVFFHPFPPV